MKTICDVCAGVGMNDKTLMNRLLCVLVVALLVPMWGAGQFYDGSDVTFGKNRVQYDDFEWKYYRFDKYETYFYTGGKDLAIYASKSAKQHIDELERYLDFYLDDKIQYLVFNKYTHYKQSNIGVIDEVTNLGGVNRVVGSKVMIYFTGDHLQFEKDIRSGTAEVLLNNLMYGGDWRNVVRNSALMEMPEWFMKGLNSHLTEGWTPEVNSYVRDGFAHRKYEKISRLEGEDAMYAGHSVWNYVAKIYGEEVIPNIIYMTKLNRNVEGGFLFVLGVSLKSLLEDWAAYYEDLYGPANQERMRPQETVLVDRKTKRKRVYTQLRTDRTGNLMAYVTNRQGKAKLFLYDREREKKKKIYKQGQRLDRLADYAYPKVAWHPSGQILAYVAEKRGQVLLHFYDVRYKKTTTKKIFRMEQVLDFSYAPDGKQLVFSGIYNGQSDIYIYNIPANTQQNITNDAYDDLTPRFVNRGKEIVFASNRKSDTLFGKIKKIDLVSSELDKDLFVYRLEDETVLRRMTDTKGISESQPIQINDGEISYLKHVNGINAVFNSRYDSLITGIDTVIHYDYFYTSDRMSAYDDNILEHDGNLNAEFQTKLMYFEGRYQMYLDQLDEEVDEEAIQRKIDEETKEKERKKGRKSEPVVEKEFIPLISEPIDADSLETREIDIDDYTFENKAPKKLRIERKVIRFDENISEAEVAANQFVLPQQRNYNLSFFRDYSIVQLNNTFLNQQYQPYDPPYQSPGLGATMYTGITDLFEDHKIYGGVRFSGENSEYSIGYQNLKRRLDKEYVVSLIKTRKSTDFTVTDVRTLRGSVLLKWPFSETAAVHGGFTVRNDKFIPKALDQFSLEQPVQNDYWATVKGAYVFDNTRQKMINIRFGTRLKIFAEYYKQVDQERSDMQVVGLDVRNYQQIHREMIFFTRLAYSTSFGRSKMVYYLGGVDDWWGLDKWDNSHPIDNEQNYQYQALATNMRGFKQNIRNGNSFAVVNTELRWPIFKYFIRKPIKSQLVKNFQVIGFGDVGTAWTGDDPYADNNALNREEITRYPITVVLEDNNEPIVGGYGFGVRSMVMGYFMRVDWAWGVENREVQDRIVYFSLSLDL